MCENIDKLRWWDDKHDDLRGVVDPKEEHRPDLIMPSCLLLSVSLALLAWLRNKANTWTEESMARALHVGSRPIYWDAYRISDALIFCSVFYETVVPFRSVNAEQLFDKIPDTASNAGNCMSILFSVSGTVPPRVFFEFCAVFACLQVLQPLFFAPPSWRKWHEHLIEFWDEEAMDNFSGAGGEERGSIVCWTRNFNWSNGVWVEAVCPQIVHSQHIWSSCALARLTSSQ